MKPTARAKTSTKARDRRPWNVRGRAREKGSDSLRPVVAGRSCSSGPAADETAPISAASPVEPEGTRLVEPDGTEPVQPAARPAADLVAVRPRMVLPVRVAGFLRPLGAANSALREGVPRA